MTLVYLMTIVLAVILLLLYAVIGVRILWHNYIEARYNRIADQYDELIYKYLAPAETLVPFTFPGIENKLNQNVLINRIHSLITNIDGVEARMLVLMFRSNGLSDDVFVKYAKGSSFRLCKALDLFGQVPAPSSVMLRIGQFMYSEDRNVRMFSLIAYFNHDSKKLIPTLKNYPHTLSMRDCANIYSFISSRSVPMHNVELLLESKNKSIVKFGEMLMKVYGMKPVEAHTI